MVTPHGCQHEVAIVDDDFGQTLDQATKSVRVKCNEREQPVQQNKDKSATESGKERGAAVDRSREHWRQNDQQDGVERCLARKRSFMAQADHDQCCNKYNHTAQWNLDKGQVLRFRAQTEHWSDKIIKCIHIWDLIVPEKSGEPIDWQK